MRIAILTGSYPPEACGVGDYTAKLIEALKKADDNVQIELIYGGSWGLSGTFDKFQELKRTGVNILHIQYPTMGYRGGVAPRILPCLFSPSVVTFHEFSNFSSKGRIGTIPLCLCAERILFASSFEREAFLRFYPWKRKTSKVIPIGSNIPSIENEEKDYNNIVFFGLIAPNKGLEDFLLLARLSLNKPCSFHFTVIGKVPESFNWYYTELRKKTDNIPIEWIIGLQEYEVANKLAHAGFGYLPFPDGVSERRGSLLALISNDVVTVTNQGIHTPKEFASFLYYSTNPNDALIKIQTLKENIRLINEKKHNMKKYIETRTWMNIAKQHLEIYRDVHKY